MKHKFLVFSVIAILLLSIGVFAQTPIEQSLDRLEKEGKIHWLHNNLEDKPREKIPESFYACENVEFIEREPTLSRYWESLATEYAERPEVLAYKIKWFGNGRWSDKWFIPGENDLSTFLNYNGEPRLKWSQFYDHEHLIAWCTEKGIPFEEVKIIEREHDQSEDIGFFPPPGVPKPEGKDLIITSITHRGDLEQSMEFPRAMLFFDVEIMNAGAEDIDLTKTSVATKANGHFFGHTPLSLSGKNILPAGKSITVEVSYADTHQSQHSIVGENTFEFYVDMTWSDWVANKGGHIQETNEENNYVMYTTYLRGCQDSEQGNMQSNPGSIYMYDVKIDDGVYNGQYYEYWCIDDFVYGAGLGNSIEPETDEPDQAPPQRVIVNNSIERPIQKPVEEPKGPTPMYGDNLKIIELQYTLDTVEVRIDTSETAHTKGAVMLTGDNWLNTRVVSIAAIDDLQAGSSYLCSLPSQGLMSSLTTTAMDFPETESEYFAETMLSLNTQLGSCEIYEETLVERPEQTFWQRLFALN